MDFAKSQPHSARGAVNDLFPFIYEAAGRMSTRAISAFLQDQERISISPSTVLRALRQPDMYFDAYLDEIEVALEVLKGTYSEADAFALLTDEHEFRAEVAKGSSVGGVSAEDIAEAESALDRALGTLRLAWWVGGPRYRREALKRLKRRWAEAKAPNLEKAGKLRK